MHSSIFSIRVPCLSLSSLRPDYFIYPHLGHTPYAIFYEKHLSLYTVYTNLYILSMVWPEFECLFINYFKTLISQDHLAIVLCNIQI